MAAKHKSLTSPLFRALTPSLSGFVSSWKNSLAGAINSPRCLIHTTGTKEAINSGTPDSIAFVKEVLVADAGNNQGFPQPQYDTEKSDIVHIKMLRNNTFVTITDSKGNKKIGVSSGCLNEIKGGAKSRYAAEATAEHAGRLSRNLGLRSVVMRVNGFTHFKKKKQAILSWKEGFTFGRADRSPINYIEDTTRRPHNGCRLPKKRRY
ncbi:small ribosomal subunit protein uS11m [Silene latifolia]|uniref:small ribosomal subunit protein uS11m n=1 Tax=Silene latifolia TaxID=37657 RepID=UPI003D76C6D3